MNSQPTIMARRTRSFNELPGHLRVPILRRKNTERTKERLAAGLAGMEELRSLRQQQQQLIGETMAKAEDKLRQEGRHGERRAKDNQSTNSESSPQSFTTPKQAHGNISRSSSRLHSMDSISEEDDDHYWAINNLNARYDKNDFDLNNNNNSDNNMDVYLGLGDGLQAQPAGNESWPSRFEYEPNFSYFSDSHPASSKNPIYQSSNGHGSETPTLPSTDTNANPLRHLDEADSVFDQPLPQGRVTSGPVTFSRRRSASDWHCHPPALVMSSRQRSMSVDMGQHHDIQSGRSRSQSSLSQLGNSPRVSSLSSLNANLDNDVDIFVDCNSGTQGNNNGMVRSRLLSQSTSRIDGNGSWQPSSNRSLNRRGSLKWDSLLKSIGIQESSSLPAAHDERSGNDEHEDDTQNNTCVVDGENTQIQINKKKGRSMSFSCGQSKEYFYQPGSNTPMGKETLIGNYQRDSHVGDNGTNGWHKDSHLRSQTSASRIHPTLRRASIQCEAVLTKTSRVVNPIQDVDVNSYKSPGPVHAVMLQYRNNTTPPRPHMITDQNANNLNHSVTPVSQAVSKCCLSGQIDTTENSAQQCSKISSNLPSHPLDIPNESTRDLTQEKQDQKCDNIIQENETVVAKQTQGISCDQNKCHDREQREIVHPDTVRYDQNGPSTFNDSNPIKAQSLMSSQLSMIPPPDSSQQYSHHSQQKMSQSDIRPRNSTTMKNESLREHDESPIRLSPIHDDNEKSSIHKESNCSGEHRPPTRDRHSNLSDTCDRAMISECKCPNRVGHRPIKQSGKQRDACINEGQQGRPPKGPTRHDAHNRQRRTVSCVETNVAVDIEPRFQFTNTSSLKAEPQSNFRLFGNVEDEDTIRMRGKRSSKFSDVSLMSDSSGKTPSSTASVFSDVSMVSDEGYSTSWDSVSPDGKGSSSTARPTRSSFTVSLGHPRNQTSETGSEHCSFTPENTGDDVNEDDKHSTNSDSIETFHRCDDVPPRRGSLGESTVECAQPVPTSPMKYQYRPKKDSQGSLRRKPFKQTAV